MIVSVRVNTRAMIHTIAMIEMIDEEKDSLGARDAI